MSRKYLSGYDVLIALITAMLLMSKKVTAPIIVDMTIGLGFLI
jgi:hypothetical protein